MSRLIVVSNRVAKPEKGSKGSEGGLAVGVMAAMEKTGGLWFGWNGKVGGPQQETIETETRGPVEYVTLPLSKQEYTHYYKGFANSVLWPLFHQRPELMNYQYADFLGYLSVNQKFARNLAPLLQADDIIWIHDYHLIPMGQALRDLGVRIPSGSFYIPPFPPWIYCVPSPNTARFCQR